MLHRRHIPSSRGVRASKHTPAFLSTNINLRNRTFTMLVTTLDKQLNFSRFGELFEYDRLARKVPTPPSRDDTNKKLSAVQVSTPAAMFPVYLP